MVGIGRRLNLGYTRYMRQVVALHVAQQLVAYGQHKSSHTTDWKYYTAQSHAIGEECIPGCVGLAFEKAGCSTVLHSFAEQESENPQPE